MNGVWEMLSAWLREAQVQPITTQVTPEIQTAGIGLLVLVGMMVLWEDWRVLLVLWTGVTVAVAFLLMPLLPLPWALSRLVAAGVGGTLLWLGARRRPRLPFRLNSGLWVRLPVVGMAGLALWQLQPYLLQIWPNPVYITSVAGLLLGGMALIALGGEVVRSTLGAQLWVHAAFFLLAWWKVSTSWVPWLTVVDLALAATGGMIAASEGLWARYQGLTQRFPAGNRNRTQWHR